MKQNTLKRSKYLRTFFFATFAAAWLTLLPGASAAVEPQPCATNPQSRQLDFWLGDWTIGAPGSSGNATSKVYLALDKCMVVESWDGGRGHKGESMLAYSSDDGSWHGMFADNEGRIHVFVDAKVRPGSAEFSGPSRGPDGQPVLNRVRIVRIDPDKVEQLWEKSTNNGVTWSTEFRGEYSRRNQ